MDFGWFFRLGLSGIGFGGSRWSFIGCVLQARSFNGWISGWFFFGCRSSGLFSTG
jgi:hypothetical protein